VASTILLTTSVMSVTLFAVYAAYSGKAEPGILLASAGVYLELVLLVCLATLFSTFTTATLSAMFTLSLFLIGHLSQSLFVLGGRAKSVGRGQRRRSYSISSRTSRSLTGRTAWCTEKSDRRRSCSLRGVSCLLRGGGPTPGVSSLLAKDFK